MYEKKLLGVRVHIFQNCFKIG